jgi:hypothetical protein
LEPAAGLDLDEKELFFDLKTAGAIFSVKPRHAFFGHVLIFILLKSIMLCRWMMSPRQLPTIFVELRL